jgi:hypothetical protein
MLDTIGDLVAGLLIIEDVKQDGQIWQ